MGNTQLSFHHAMSSSPLSELLRLPTGDRAELAMALWDSLTESEREALVLTDAQRAELDRRWAAHVANPDSSIDWVDVRRCWIDPCDVGSSGLKPRARR